MKFASHLLVASALVFSGLCGAQSTIGDPTPMLGDQARSIAGNTALGGSAMQGSNTTSPAEFARRKAHTDQAKACRANYQSSTQSGSPQRAAARKACESTLAAQRATWYAKK